MWWVSLLLIALTAAALVAALVSQRQTGQRAGSPPADSARPYPPVSPAWKVAAAVAAAGVLILGGGNLLSGAGTSGKPSEDPVAALASATARLERPASKIGDVETMIGALAERLRSSPSDAEGWRMLGWSYFNTQRYAEAAAAFGEAARLVPGNLEYRSLQAEALVQAAGGTVTPEARKMFENVLKADASDFRSRYYSALDRQQSGDLEGALAQWSALLADAPPEAEWTADVKGKVAQLAGKLGRDAAAAPSSVETTLVTSATEPAADQDEMIRGMVDGLAARLARSPNDAEGWVKLIRSRMVLQQPGLAREALAKAVSVFASEPLVRDDIVASARALGVTLE